MRRKTLMRIILVMVALNILANLRSFLVWRARRERLSKPEVVHV
jgi:hypothetical protein